MTSLKSRNFPSLMVFELDGKLVAWPVIDTENNLKQTLSMPSWCSEDWVQQNITTPRKQVCIVIEGIEEALDCNAAIFVFRGEGKWECFPQDRAKPSYIFGAEVPKEV